MGRVYYERASERGCSTRSCTGLLLLARALPACRVRVAPLAGVCGYGRVLAGMRQHLRSLDRTSWHARLVRPPQRVRVLVSYGPSNLPNNNNPLDY